MFAFRQVEKLEQRFNHRTFATAAAVSFLADPIMIGLQAIFWPRDL
jgi:hypothetical protein